MREIVGRNRGPENGRMHPAIFEGQIPGGHEGDMRGKRASANRAQLTSSADGVEGIQAVLQKHIVPMYRTILQGMAGTKSVLGRETPFEGTGFLGDIIFPGVRYLVNSAPPTLPTAGLLRGNARKR